MQRKLLPWSRPLAGHAAILGGICCEAVLKAGFAGQRPAPRLLLVLCACLLLAGAQSPCPIQFALKSIPFRLENDPTPGYNVPETMAGGVATFDYNGDGRPDIFFTNGANIATLKKDSPKYYDRLFRNDGNGKFTDVTAAAGLEGT
ncbi:MAG: FG-GAP repeat domain-containing protein, partial [Terriglobia bacterium]